MVIVNTQKQLQKLLKFYNTYKGVYTMITLIDLLYKQIDLINKRSDINICYLKARLELLNTYLSVDSAEYAKLRRDCNTLRDKREKINSDIKKVHNQIDILINDMLN